MARVAKDFQVKNIKISPSDIAEWQNMMLNTHGWYVHYIPEDENLVNIHTHGLFEKFDHDDFQIVVPLPEKTAQVIFKTFLDRIKGGEKFKSADVVEHIITNYSVKLIDAIESNRTVLRIILPDKFGKLDKISMESPFHLQYCGISVH